MPVDGNVVIPGLFFHQHGHVFNDPIDIHRLDHRLPLAGKIQQLRMIPVQRSTCWTTWCDATPQFLHFVSAQSLLFQQMLHPFGFLADDGQGIVDFMGNAGGQLPQGRQFLRLEQALFQKPFSLVLSASAIWNPSLSQPGSQMGVERHLAGTL